MTGRILVAPNVDRAGSSRTGWPRDAGSQVRGHRLTGTGMQPATTDRWLDAWVMEATGRGLAKDGAYWQAG